MWEPDNIPKEIMLQIDKFCSATQRNFISCNGRSNISKFQASTLESIQKNENVVICHADKNLGPVGVNTTQYISWALNNHLLDTTTYIQVSEADARVAAFELFTDIWRWTYCHGYIDILTLIAQK